LIKILPGDKFKIFVTGTAQEGKFVKNIFSENQWYEPQGRALNPTTNIHPRPRGSGYFMNKN